MYSAPKLPKKESEKGTKNQRKYVFIGAICIVAVVLVAAVVVLIAFYNSESKSDKQKSCNFSSLGEVSSSQNTFKLHYFEWEDDVQRMTVQSNTSITVFKISEGILVGSDNRSYLFWHKCKNEAIIVDMDSDRISIVSSIERVRKEEIKTNGSIDVGSLTQLECTVLHDHVGITQGGKLPLTLMRPGPNDENITILTKPLTTVIERRGSDELRLLLGKYTELTKAQKLISENRTVHSFQRKEEDTCCALCEVCDEQLWEEMTVRPSALNFAADNLFGTFELRNEEAVYMNSYLQGNFTGSPFKHKFGRITKFGKLSANNGMMEVDFSDDECGRSLFVSEDGNEYWIFVKKREAGMRRVSDGGSLVWKDGLLETSDKTLLINFNNDSVYVEDGKVEKNKTENCNKWTTWKSSKITVEMTKECTKNAEWNIRTHFGIFAAGTVKDMICSIGKDTIEYGRFFEGGTNDSFLGSGDSMAGAFCGYRMNFDFNYYSDHKRDDPVLKMSALEKMFQLRANPGDVLFENGMAEIASLTANISITPFPIHFD